MTEDGGSGICNLGKIPAYRGLHGRAAEIFFRNLRKKNGEAEFFNFLWNQQVLGCNYDQVNG